MSSGSVEMRRTIPRFVSVRAVVRPAETERKSDEEMHRGGGGRRWGRGRDGRLGGGGTGWGGGGRWSWEVGGAGGWVVARGTSVEEGEGLNSERESPIQYEYIRV